MICAKRNCAYALLTVLFICLQNSKALCKEGKNLNTENTTTRITSDTVDRFQWHEHNKLSWDDFRGDVAASNDESAAATYCAIGFKTNTTAPGNKEIIVYNTFYTNKSWVRSDAKISSILEHEQGHFDLCEIYTRKLRDRMSKFDCNAPNVMQSLMSVYTAINNEYETRQQAYEQETIHGTNIEQQKRWGEMIAREL